jgi:acetamidase/formamidase
MDILEAGPGNTVYLPVFLKGGYLYLGDAHAAQGHGELSIVGLEMPAETEITVRLLKQKKLTHPRIETPDELIAISTSMSMERCYAHATSMLILWLEAEYGWDRWRAFDLITHVGTMTLGYYGLGTVGMKILKKYATNPC